MSDTIRFLLELRRRLLRFLLVYAVVLLPALYFANSIYYYFALPLLKNLPGATSGIIAINVTAPLFVPFQSAFAASFFLTVPYLLWQLWGFVAPALYHQEKRVMWWMLFISIILFYLGVAFAYYLVVPTVLQFLMAMAPVGVTVMPDISQYYSFVLRLLLVFGFCFEVPVCIVLLCSSGLCSIDTLAEYRRYVIVAAFVLGMLLTPPDVVSQILLAIPLWLLYESGLIISRLLLVNRPVLEERK